MSALFNSSSNQMDYFNMAFLEDIFDLPDNIIIQTPFGNVTTENPREIIVPPTCKTIHKLGDGNKHYKLKLLQI